MFADYLEKMQTDPVAGFTALLVLATLILAGIAYLQIRQGRIVQRAYVAVEPLGVHLMVEGDRVIGHIGIRNAGRLPARQLSWFINIKHSNKGNEETFDVGKANGKITITPGARARRGSDKYITLQDLISAVRVLGLKSALRLERRGKQGQEEPEQHDHRR